MNPSKPSVKMPHVGLCEEEIHSPPELIRNRISYAFWKPIVENMAWMPFHKLVHATSIMWNQMDSAHKFGTMRQAGFELESLALCLLETKKNFNLDK